MGNKLAVDSFWANLIDVCFSAVVLAFIWLAFFFVPFGFVFSFLVCLIYLWNRYNFDFVDVFNWIVCGLLSAIIFFVIKTFIFGLITNIFLR